jgi:hypothetical protein
MKFFLIIISLNLCSIVGMAADSKPISKTIIAAKPTPLVEEVPEPGIEPENIPSTKVTKGTRDAVKETKLGLIKTEKLHYDKTCRMVNGKMKCGQIKNKLKKPY